MTKTILIIDDEERLRSLLKAYLGQEGFRVLESSNGRDAIFVARQEKPDLIILDIMMPEMDGYEFMRLHRQERNTPIILLTAKVEDGDKILGLELGADDYITKPFSPREVTARIRAVLRRGGLDAPTAPVLQSGALTVDRDAHLATINSEVLSLTRSEFDLLAALIAAPGRTFSRLDLLDYLQGTAYAGYERVIDVHIKNLRLKIGDDPRQPRFIETVYGVGYRFKKE
jgi:DNA-binding response OmpR family regulator